MSHCQGPIPPRSEPFAIAFEVAKDKKKIRAHCVRLETFEIEGDMNDVTFQLLTWDRPDPRISDLWNHIKANPKP